MYLVTIINNGVETAINEVSTNTKNRVSGTVKQGINTINSFTFTILPNNQGYNLISPLSTLVKVLNTKTNKYEFIGRVLSPTHSMDSNGLISKSYVCESELGYLLDTYQSYEEIHNISVRGYLERLIQTHNNSTDNSKKFVVGNVTVVDNNDSLYRYIAYDTTKKNIYDDLIDKLGGELQIRYENDIRYLDYLTEIGKVCSTEIRLGKNLQSIEQNIDLGEYCNRIIPLGTKLKVKDNEGNETDTDKRLTIESVNNGLKYIDDEESIAKYGIIQGQVIYDDVTDAENLFNKGQKYLLSQRLSFSNKVNALDLSLIGIDIDSFEVGNYYPLIHEILGINDIVRVVKKNVSIDNPHSSSIELGELKGNVKTYFRDIKTQASKNTQLESKLNSQFIYLDNVNNAIVQTSQSLTEISSEVSELGNNTSETINIMLESIQLLNENVENISNNLTTINNKLEEINNSLLEVNNRVTSLEEKTETLEEGITSLEERVEKLETPTETEGGEE